MPLQRSMAEILGAHADAIKNDIKCCIPATVTAVHADRMTVDVQIGLNNPVHDDLGNVYSEPAAGISDVPLGVLRGGGFFVWMPVQVGDFVLLIVSDLSVDAWRSAGDDGSPVDPLFVGKHTFDSPFAIPMVAPDGKVFADPGGEPNKVIIGKDGGSAQIRISAVDIQLGSSATEFVALANLVNTELGKIANAFSSFVPGSGGAGFTDPYTTAGDVSATVAKAQ